MPLRHLHIMINRTIASTADDSDEDESLQGAIVRAHLLTRVFEAHAVTKHLLVDPDSLWLEREKSVDRTVQLVDRLGVRLDWNNVKSECNDREVVIFEVCTAVATFRTKIPTAVNNGTLQYAMHDVLTSAATLAASAAVQIALSQPALPPHPWATIRAGQRYLKVVAILSEAVLFAGSTPHQQTNGMAFQPMPQAHRYIAFWQLNSLYHSFAVHTGAL